MRYDRRAGRVATLAHPSCDCPFINLRFPAGSAPPMPVWIYPLRDSISALRAAISLFHSSRISRRRSANETPSRIGPATRKIPVSATPITPIMYIRRALQWGITRLAD